MKISSGKVLNAGEHTKVHPRMLPSPSIREQVFCKCADYVCRGIILNTKFEFSLEAENWSYRSSLSKDGDKNVIDKVSNSERCSQSKSWPLEPDITYEARWAKLVIQPSYEENHKQFMERDTKKKEPNPDSNYLFAQRWCNRQDHCKYKEAYEMLTSFPRESSDCFSNHSCRSASAARSYPTADVRPAFQESGVSLKRC